MGGGEDGENSSGVEDGEMEGREGSGEGEAVTGMKGAEEGVVEATRVEEETVSRLQVSDTV